MHTVTVTDPARVADFKRVFGSATVPVKVRLPIPQQASIPAGYQGRQVERPCYQLDIGALTNEQRENLIAYTMERFGMSRAECVAELPRGFPILADSCLFTTDALDFL